MHTRRALTDRDLPARLRMLGFRDDDADDAVAAARAAASSAEDLRHISVLAERVLEGLGRFGPEVEDPWDYPGARLNHLGVGVLPMLAMLVTIDDIRDFHNRRGIPEDVSIKSLSDLGQQTWVHRATFGNFGLDTFGWMRFAWSGNLYWLGRLQFNLKMRSDRWVLSTHVPRTGPLTPDEVDDSFTRALRFFGDHFAEYPIAEFYCLSWLLDPELIAGPLQDSNIAKFQRRWTLQGEPVQSDSDALFFTFLHRGEVDLDQLPRTTTLQRVVVDRLKAGRHWHIYQGTRTAALDTRSEAYEHVG